MKRRGLNFISE